jgi:2,3-bisphosphoglycerate-independent phosphoglycerate mutase
VQEELYIKTFLINNAVADNSIAQNETILEAFNYAKDNKSAVHFMSLVSDGGIHSHQKHLYKLCELAKENKVDNVYVHAFTDGRYCDPKVVKIISKDLKRT